MKIKNITKFRKNNKKLLASLLVSLTIFGLLILSSPAQAFNLSLETSNNSPLRGEFIYFDVSLNINSDEILPVDYLSFSIDGPQTINCKFYPNMTIISGCGDLIINISSADYTYGNLSGVYSGYGYSWGYGYGYGSSQLKYRITLDTLNLENGTYTPTFETFIRGDNFFERGDEFTISEPSPFELKVYLPINKTYNTAKIPINVTLSEIGSISYINYNDKTPKIKSLCKNCLEYGNKAPRNIFLKDGANNITIIAKNNVQTIEQKFVVFVDSTKSKISSIYPFNNQYSNGSNIKISYFESNLKNITLFYGAGESVVKNDCNSGNAQCNFNIDISSYNGQVIPFWFEIRDIANNVAISRKTNIKVDTTIPLMNVYIPIEDEEYNIMVPLNISVSEKVKIIYKDYNEVKPKWKTLCSNCDNFGELKKRTKYFPNGLHQVVFFAVDNAGNAQSKEINFETN